MASNRKRVKEDKFLADPLDFDIPDTILCLSEVRTPMDLTITTDSYVSLCSRLYAAICNENPKFFGEIPESAFQFYAIVHLWKRFAQLFPCSATNGSTFFDNLARVNDDYYSFPSPIQKYLDVIGHFRDPHHYDRRFTLPVYPNDEADGGIAYTFGRVSAKTHYFYEAYPAPGIAVLRMLADIKYTNDPCEENLIWDLPDGLRPYRAHGDGCMKSIKPTKNLLGWAPAQTLNYRQLNILKSFINNDELLMLEEDVCNLFQSLSRKMGNYITPAQQLRLHLIEEGGFALYPASSRGSLAQGMVSKKKLDSFTFDRSLLYCEGNIAVCSAYKVHPTLIKGAAITGY